MIQSVTGRAAVLDAVGFHPYARLTTGGHGDEVTGYFVDGATAWVGLGPWGPVACAFGDPLRAAVLFADLAAAGALCEARWLHLPRIRGEALAPYLEVAHQDDWDFLWTTTPPPQHPLEADVVRLDTNDDPDIESLLATAFPETTSRPGDPHIRGWYGARDAGGRLIACGADRSTGGIGFLAGLAVHVDARGRGLGTALTAAMVRRMFALTDVVALGVMWDNAPAIRLYARLGFTESIARSSVSAPSMLLSTKMKREPGSWASSSTTPPPSASSERP